MELVPTRAISSELVWAGGLLLFSMVIVRWICQIIYNLYFHPLSKIPGPPLAAASEIPFCRWSLVGHLPYKLLELHNKYGHAVRVAPNEVSFSSAQSWKDIYGQKKGHREFLKGAFYDHAGFVGRGYRSIASERRPEAHKEMRNYLASGFSERATLEQEVLIAPFIDKLVRLVGVKGSGEKGLDVTTAFESMTFDIACDLTFGETFGALDMETRHPWIAGTLEGNDSLTLLDILTRYPTVAKVIGVFVRQKLRKRMAEAEKKEQLEYETTRRRIQRETNRNDFLARVIRDRDPNVVSDMQLAAHAETLILAASDTSASCLSATLYYLLQTPSAMETLKAEIRGSFEKMADITYASTLEMPYLCAVIQESLRIFPPVPVGLPRLVPDGGDTVDGYYLPGGVVVYTSPIPASQSPANFHDPSAFKPERWIRPSGCCDARDASQPFSLGNRSCLGRNLAWLEIRTTVAKLVWVYDLEAVDASVDWPRMSQPLALWHKAALMVRARNRGVVLE